VRVAQTAASDAMLACCSVVGNRDVEPFVPTLINCMARPAEVAEGIHKLGAITFVQASSVGLESITLNRTDGMRPSRSPKRLHVFRWMPCGH